MLSIVPSISLNWDKPFFRKKETDDSFVTRVYQNVKKDLESIHHYMETKPLEAGNICAYYGLAGLALGPVGLICELVQNALLFFGVRRVYLELKETEKFKGIQEYFPSSKLVNHALVGYAAHHPATGLETLLGSFFTTLEKKSGISFDEEQDIEEMLQNPVAFEILLPYITIFGPFIEEVLFRGYLQDYFTPVEKKKGKLEMLLERVGLKSEEKETFLSKVRKKAGPILKTSIIFGVTHGSIAQKWSNLPIITIITIFGIILSILKEYTGDLWAPFVLHSLSNIRATVE